MDAVRSRAVEAPPIALPRDLPIVMTVGRLVDPKGLERAVKVHKRLSDRGIDFRWYIIGDGPLRHKLEDQALKLGLQDRFILLGESSNPFCLMKQADIFALLSYHEGFGLATLEAMSLGLPILLADFGAARECIKNGGNGIIARGNVRCIAESLERMLADATLRGKLRENLQAFEWDNEAILRKTERVLFEQENRPPNPTSP
jgi:glycosyltransferase involved in cell wall biosynthesis